MGVPMNYGLCVGGPFHKKHMAHATESYRVAVNRVTKKGIPAMQASTDPDLKFGEYRWENGGWAWHTAPVNAEER